MSGSLDGKVAIVTGATTGIGRGIAVAFARAGAQVVVGDIIRMPRPESFDERPDLSTADLIAEIGGSAIFVDYDVTRREAAQAAIEAALAFFGRLDIMVNNAGIGIVGKRFHEFSDADFDRTIDVNIKGMWFGMQEAAKHFISAGGGSIINMLSTAAIRQPPMQAIYNMSKAAAAQMTRSAALEYGRYNIRVNGICPTMVKTSLTRELTDNAPLMNYIVGTIALGRFAEVSDVAHVATFFASDAAAFLSGVLLPVDGAENPPLYMLGDAP
ncbi:SDR family NAD(P)-dependent oxidoreductase [Xanthomonas vasicola]|uniref:SDR family NAD(P)-dependent oxidoreductase n=1 Tax=Xanthomonas vasicola TaxID=56459 RepID=UPI0001CC0D09|nr:SDR family oxidoreductase [Xanthomonas vasicola]AZR31701.1 SDR family oxidoreductase [Xanthomonas vasicola pv. musacearum NCPPB 4379]KFA08389.1 short-chain dehydrogenase [Xanthomonas vasicola pv. musacearum NCPPB 2005]KFA08798.1 short-chain dehydrogenase [Xanthomonas vasicola pv. musacearum NCPPB 4380]KFA15426.1 short-chain dehydrogenase [Xanthomonas vasicola pv. musacearum NCPPB 4392]KFA17444.1 short-chain dehydrogenase [Xanthomonas vasicola pv. musacearum NCPPB 4394]